MTNKSVNKIDKSKGYLVRPLEQSLHGSSSRHHGIEVMSKLNISGGILEQFMKNDAGY